jgi:hypothetical protein
VVERLRRLADREAISVNAVAVRELTDATRRADNPLLLGELPDFTLDVDDIVADLEDERARR